MRVNHLFEKLKVFPLGDWIFSTIVSFKAPYFFSVRPRIIHLNETECFVKIRKRFFNLNHIGTMHAIAMCNACELAMGMVMESGLPGHLRWIPKSMTVKYLAKGETDLFAKCQFPKIKELNSGDVFIPVKVFDKNDKLIMTADIEVHVSEKKH